jgi:hypothetical protein
MAGLLSRIFLQPAQTSVPARLLLGLPVVLVALKKIMGKKKPKQLADGEKPKPKRPDHIGMLWKEVWPTWLSLDGHMLVLILGNSIRACDHRAGSLTNRIRMSTPVPRPSARAHPHCRRVQVSTYRTSSRTTCVSATGCYSRGTWWRTAPSWYTRSS